MPLPRALPASIADIPIIGYRRDGRPIRAVAGASGDGDPDPGPADTGQPSAPATPPAAAPPRQAAPMAPAPQTQAPAQPAAGTGQTLAEQGITPQLLAQIRQAAGADTAPRHATDGDRDLSKQPRWIQDMVRDLREEAAGHRVRYKEADQGATALRAAIAEAAGLDVADVTTDNLSELFGYAAAEAQSALVQKATVRAALQHGGDASALLSWQPFLDKADALDPTDDDFNDQLSELVKETVANTHILRAQQGQAPRSVPTRSGAEIPGGSGNPSQITEADLASMSPDQITEALEQGRLAHLL